MKLSALVVLLTAGSALAMPIFGFGDDKGAGGKGALAKAGEAAKGKGDNNAGAAAAASKGSASSAEGSSAVGSSAVGSSADNSTASVGSSADSSSVDSSADSSSASATSSNSTAASSTSSASSATRTRPCDMGDQSLAAGLSAMTTIGIGQQAAVATVQAANNTADFKDAVTRLQQFITTQGAQLTMAQGIADDDSFAQKQLKLLAASQTSQEAAVKGLTGDAQKDAAALTSLAQSVLDSTNNAQDGAEQALIDCFIPVNAVSG